MFAPRRSRPKRAPWIDPQYDPQKQQARDLVAEAIARHCGDSPAVFVMPSYGALCAKTINKLVPNAAFYGTERTNAAGKIFDVAPGKPVIMQGKKTVRRYIEDNTGKLEFEAAFLDYTTTYEAVRQEVQDFAAKLLKPSAVLAITIQRTTTAEAIRQDLLRVRLVVILETNFEYDTTIPMMTVIFLLRKPVL